ncbi:hypothetical protein BJP24_21790 [Aeromonas allosaccharophila]|nr:hypothetical protein BJP24_21790 [Aeromonas allosaccharophila]
MAPIKATTAAFLDIKPTIFAKKEPRRSINKPIKIFIINDLPQFEPLFYAKEQTYKEQEAYK